MTKILAVDDEKEICNFVSDFFKERGYEVLTAGNGYEALKIVEKEEDLLVLLDIRMPKMDGIETLRLIKEKKPDTQVIMVTCVDDLEKMETAKEYGAETYITKPLVLDELLNAVMSRISKQGSPKRKLED